MPPMAMTRNNEPRLNAGYRIEYDGGVTVTHSHEEAGRSDWRRYYYDTRNLLIVASRHMRFGYGCRYLARGLGAMFVYSIRDGFIGQYLRGVYDGLRMLVAGRAEREVWSRDTEAYFRRVDRERPSLGYYVRSRLLRRKVEI